MDLKFVETLAGVLERSAALSEIEYGDGQRHVTLKRGSSPRAIQANASAQLATARAATVPVVATVAAHKIVAGMIGTFYRAPSPHQPAFVSIGDTVEEGQTLAIVEAMKLLNPIEADRAGRIAEILVPDGAAVSTDTALFVIEDLETTDV